MILFIYLFIYLLTYLLTYLLIYLLIYLFIYRMFAVAYDAVHRVRVKLRHSNLWSHYYLYVLGQHSVTAGSCCEVNW